MISDKGNVVVPSRAQMSRQDPVYQGALDKCAREDTAGGCFRQDWSRGSRRSSRLLQDGEVPGLRCRLSSVASIVLVNRGRGGGERGVGLPEVRYRQDEGGFEGLSDCCGDDGKGLALGVGGLSRALEQPGTKLSHGTRRQQADFALSARLRGHWKVKAVELRPAESHGTHLGSRHGQPCLGDAPAKLHVH
ncbi:hypothetical protein HYQ46_003657 [Verticillium longisporum]|nr:hypothetical protein HYQ46_003657 [Verticillium longisporum]